MGKQNKQRRAAKAKTRQRRAAQDRQSYRGDGAWACTCGHCADDLSAMLPEIIAQSILAAAIERAYVGGEAARLCAKELVNGQLGEAPERVDAAADLAADQVLARVLNAGWTPADVHQQVSRTMRDVEAGYVADRLAALAEPFPAQRIHPRWHAQLGELGAKVWWGSDRPHFGQWTARLGQPRVDALEAVIELLAHLLRLPDLPRILPLPGEQTHQLTGAETGVNERMLARVRALLAKAESTAFAEEAEALSAKAQELMSRHSIERALVEAKSGTQQVASGRRIWLDNPYLSPKSLLVQAVAKANRCRTVFYGDLGFVTVLGDEGDLDSVELLTTSLLVQASRAMLAQGSQVTRYGQSRTRSYRQSFLVAYAGRIGERLAETAATMTEQATATGGGDGAASAATLLPVLAARAKAVDDLFDSLFPRLVSKPVSVSNYAGYGAGRAAADLAVLDVRKRVSA